MGDSNQVVEQAIKKAKPDNVVRRIWDHDYTLWKPQPDEITNRLGWLDIAERNQPHVPELVTFCKNVKRDGIDRVLLLGMGGSSLAPDMFSKIFTHSDGLALQVLDSTDPKAVLAKAETHPIGKTLFIVSSKSGGTTENSIFL